MAIIGTLPNTISNGQNIDAIPVMADFNYIVSQVNTNGAPLASPTFTGTPVAPTPASSDNSTTLSTTAYVVGAVIGKNTVINGDCSISQVNGSTLVTPLTASYPIDNVVFAASQASKFQTQQVFNKLNSLGATTALTVSVLNSYAPIATDYFDIHFPIEGFNFARFQYGTANAKPGSLQFKVSATVAGTYSAAIQNYAGTRSYPFTFVIAVANTDTLITVPNIPGDTAGTWVGATNAGAAYITIDLGSGTNFKSTGGTWQTGNFVGVTGSVNLVAQVNGSTLTISDVQFEVGSVCTQFERKLISQNLFECQRYYVPFTGQYAGTSGTGVINLIVPTGCTMRATPTCTNTASGSGSGYASSYSGSTWSSVAVSANSFTATAVGAACVNIQAPYGPSAQGFPCAGGLSGTLSAQI